MARAPRCAVSSSGCSGDGSAATRVGVALTVMVRCCPWGAALALHLPAPARAQEQEQEQEPPRAALESIRRILEREHHNRPSFIIAAQCDRLMSADPSEREDAGEQLYALVVEMARFAEEADADGRFDDYYTRKERARIERTDLARRLGALPLTGNEAVPALLWIWRHGEGGEERALAARGMSSVPTAEADSFFQQALAERSSVAWACRCGLERVRNQGMTVDDDVLLALCDYHEKGVRQLACELADARGILVPEPEVVGLDAELRHTLDVALSLLPEEVDEDRGWVELHIPGDGQNQGPEPSTLSGWLLREGKDGGGWKLMTSYGSVVEVGAQGVIAKPSTLRKYVRHLMSERKRWAETEDVDTRARIEGEQGLHRSAFSSGDRWKGSPAELLAAAWSMQRHDDRDAARLLRPLLADAWDTRDRLDPLLNELAGGLDAAMLVAFATDRDYPKAIELARKLAIPELRSFPQQRRALELLAQLPERAHDFGELQLPTPARWSEFCRTSGRTERIAYLVARLRLLTCAQWSNPGGLSYLQEQYGVPGTIPGQGGETDPRVNPFEQLLLMDLAAEELAVLLPVLESRHYILGFDFDRFGIMTSTRLHRVSWVAATICNEVAQEEIADPRLFLGTEAERQQARGRLLAFGRQHAGQHASDLLAARIASEEDWQEIRQAFWKLNSVNPVRAAATMREVGRRNPERMPQIVRLLALLDRAEFLGEARDWLSSDDPDQSYFAAVLSLRHRQATAEAFAIVAARLGQPDGAELVPGAVEALLACQLPEAGQLLQALLSGTHESGYVPSLPFCQRLMRAGERAAYEVLGRALAGEVAVAPYAELGTEARTMVILQMSTWWSDLDRSAAQAGTAGAEDGLAERLGKRLDGDWQRITSGQEPTFEVREVELPWGDLLSFSTGWIRRM